MIAFAGNSILCRIALKDTGIDPAGFTAIRLLSGALVLGLLVRIGRKGRLSGGNWLSAFALFAYAAGFSFAYLDLTAATGALLLFAAVQVTMIGYGLIRGERLARLQLIGLVLACGGLTGLLLPGLSAPPPGGSALMLLAGVAWGVYSLRGRRGGDPTEVTAGNFLLALPFVVVLCVARMDTLSMDTTGIWYAVLSGGLASGLGYAVWYTALRGLRATSAATVQLSVPVIAALGGIILLGEPLTVRFALASAAVLGGIALVLYEKRVF